MTTNFFSRSIARWTSLDSNNGLWAGVSLTLLTACALPANADSFTYTGAAQSFTASTTGVYQIVAYGAQGGFSNTYQSSFPGGAGAEIGGSFILLAGETLTVDVGGHGGGSGTGGGGGGSFVVASNGTALVIAGGGGGADFGGNAGQPGLTTTSGGDGGVDSGAGGSGGQGGQGGGPGGGGGGAGFNGSGGDAVGGGGSAYPSLEGGAGFETNYGYGAPGGYGGGGGGGQFYGGGGGGYSGGGGANYTGTAGGGGGGSYLDASAADTILLAGVQDGNGTVTITELTTVPEPGSLMLIACGIGLLAFATIIRLKSVKSRRKPAWSHALLAIALLAISAFGASQAKADTITTFDAAGIFADGASLSGTLTIDTTAGTIQSASLDAGAPDDFTASQVTVAQANSFGSTKVYELEIYPPGPQTGEYLLLLLPTGSLVGYSGGPLYSTTDDGPAGATSIFTADYSRINLVSGQITPELVTSTPEPASLTILGSGLVAIGLLYRFKRA